ncbi:MAG: GH12 family glycosyl hydrolase domain-containing protein [Phycicoccus sp.]
MQLRRRRLTLTGALVGSVLWSLGAAAGSGAAAVTASQTAGTAARTAVAAPELCDATASTPVADGRYIVQNNRWGASTTQCIDVRGNGFAITRADHANSTSGPPAAYPSIYAGCHYGNCTSGNGLPLQVSQFGDVRATYLIDTPDSGEWNASFDLWFDPTQRTTGQNTGAELMIWADHRGRPQPIGSKQATVTLEGAAWDVWVGNVGWNVISYVRQQPTDAMSDFSVRAFVDDAVSRGQVQPAWYMTSVQAGFEPWVGGTGLAVRDFSFTTAGGGTGGGGADRTILGAGSSRCLDAAGTTNGTSIQLWDCAAGNARQSWTRDGETFVNPASGLCLDVQGASTDDGARVQLWGCHGGDAQRWIARSDGALVNPHSGKCLDAAGADNGARVQIWSCDGRGAAPNQRWTVR